MYGKNLKYQRESYGLNQSQLAKATGLNQQMISYWEADEGDPNIRFCVKLADFYGITLDELIGREPPREYTAPTENGSFYNSGTIIKSFNKK